MQFTETQFHFTSVTLQASMIKMIYNTYDWSMRRLFERKIEEIEMLKFMKQIAISYCMQARDFGIVTNAVRKIDNIIDSIDLKKIVFLDMNLCSV